MAEQPIVEQVSAGLLQLADRLEAIAGQLTALAHEIVQPPDPNAPPGRLERLAESMRTAVQLVTACVVEIKGAVETLLASLRPPVPPPA
jgi:hypothetical protein